MPERYPILPKKDTPRTTLTPKPAARVEVVNPEMAEWNELLKTPVRLVENAAGTWAPVEPVAKEAIVATPAAKTEVAPPPTREKVLADIESEEGNLETWEADNNQSLIKFAKNRIEELKQTLRDIEKKEVENTIPAATDAERQEAQTGSGAEIIRKNITVVTEQVQSVRKRHERLVGEINTLGQQLLKVTTEIAQARNGDIKMSELEEQRKLETIEVVKTKIANKGQEIERAIRSARESFQSVVDVMAHMTKKDSSENEELRRLFQSAEETFELIPEQVNMPELRPRAESVQANPAETVPQATPLPEKRLKLQLKGLEPDKNTSAQELERRIRIVEDAIDGAPDQDYQNECVIFLEKLQAHLYRKLTLTAEKEAKPPTLTREEVRLVPPEQAVSPIPAPDLGPKSAAYRDTLEKAKEFKKNPPKVEDEITHLKLNVEILRKNKEGREKVKDDISAAVWNELLLEWEAVLKIAETIPRKDIVRPESATKLAAKQEVRISLPPKPEPKETDSIEELTKGVEKQKEFLTWNLKDQKDDTHPERWAGVILEQTERVGRWERALAKKEADEKLKESRKNAQAPQAKPVFTLPERPQNKIESSDTLILTQYDTEMKIRDLLHAHPEVKDVTEFVIDGSKAYEMGLSIGVSILPTSKIGKIFGTLAKVNIKAFLVNKEDTIAIEWDGVKHLMTSEDTVISITNKLSGFPKALKAKIEEEEGKVVQKMQIVEGKLIITFEGAKAGTVETTGEKKLREAKERLEATKREEEALLEELRKLEGGK